MGLAGARATDEDYVLSTVEKLTFVQLPQRRLVDLAGHEVEAGEILVGREACSLHVIGDAKGHDASPRTALSLLARTQKHTAHAGARSFQGLSKTTPEQLDLFDVLNLPKPAWPLRCCHIFGLSA